MAIASQWQNKHRQFNDALMRTEGKLSSEKIRAAANTAGIDFARLERDMEAREDDIDGVLRRTAMQAAQMGLRSEEHTSELQSLMRISYAVFCLKQKKKTITTLKHQTKAQQ